MGGLTSHDPAGQAGSAVRKARRAAPRLVGEAEQRLLRDNEASPRMARANSAFLAADVALAAIANQQRILAQLHQQAQQTMTLYRALAYDVLSAQTRGRELAAADGPISDGVTRADLRAGVLTVARAELRETYQRLLTRYDAQRQLVRAARGRLGGLTASRAAAVAAMRAAQPSDLAQHRAQLAESDALSAQIQAASLALSRAGRTVQGTGDLAAPLHGSITSPFGNRVHPILGYEKLHTGLDLAGTGVIRAADTGRVLMTLTSRAYGNYTVIDHGVVKGRRITTAYAHQERFLVEAGDVVRRGDPIGVVGSTGLSTGPHLHFEVRENGVPVDPLGWL